MRIYIVLVCVVLAIAVESAREAPINSAHVIPELNQPARWATQEEAPTTQQAVVDAHEFATLSSPADIGSGVSCTHTEGGNTWNLAPLTKAPGGGDYKGKDANYDYKMNVCGVSNAGQGCTENGYSICQYSQSGGVFVASLGSFAEPPKWQAMAGNKGVQYTMTNGNKCWIAGKEVIRTVINQFTCAASTSDTFTVAEDINTCTFTIALNTQYGCLGGSPSGGGGSGMGGGLIFVIIFVSIIPVYVLVGCLFKWRTKATRLGSMESCPHGEFWKDLPALVKDGCKYTFMMIKTGCKYKPGQQYDEL